MKHPEIERKGRAISFNLIIDAPRNFTGNMRSDPNLLPKYFRTDSVWTKSFKGEIRPGGNIELVFEDKDGNEYTSRTNFIEVVPNERVKYEIESSLLPGKKILTTESMEDYLGRTKYVVTMIFERDEDLYKMMDIGWHLRWSEYMARFGKLVSETLREEEILE